MKSRILTALVLLPPVIYLIGWASEWLFLLAVLATVERGLYEYFHISRQAGFQSLPVVGYVAGAAVCLVQTTAVRRIGELAPVVLVLIILLTAAFALRWTSDLKQYLGAVTTTIFGVLYVAFTLSWLLPLRFSAPATGQKVIFLLFLVVWAGDICAFLVGRSVGRHLLFPRVSPKKTVEGGVAGMVGSLLVAWAFAHWFWRTTDLKTVFLLAALIAVAGQVGDLVESALKRCAGLKDSAALLPGHGGLLDRIDSLLFGVPVLWVALATKDLWPW
jgi:phosphatidate cytidylyltransferase